MTDWWKEISGAFAVLVGAVWGDNRRRVLAVERKLDAKVDKDEFNRQRDDVSKLFGCIADLRTDVHKMHIDLLEKIK